MLMMMMMVAFKGHIELAPSFTSPLAIETSFFEKLHLREIM